MLPLPYSGTIQMVCAPVRQLHIQLMNEPSQANLLICILLFLLNEVANGLFCDSMWLIMFPIHGTQNPRP